MHIQQQFLPLTLLQKDFSLYLLKILFSHTIYGNRFDRVKGSGFGF